MERPEVLEVVLQQLPLRSLLACTLVSRRWHDTAHGLIQRYQLAGFDGQRDTLRCFTLDKSTTAPTKHFFHSLPLLSNLVSLTITPDALIAPDETNRRTLLHDPTQLCLAGLLPALDKLRHLYLHGQDLRYRPIGRESETQLGGTDNALLAFAASRRVKGLPGLQTLSIVSSPDLTDEGLAVYLNTTNSHIGAAEDDKCTYEGQYTLGQSLVSLTLVNTPRITVRSLSALEEHCKHLVYLDLRNTDGFLADSSQLDLLEPEDSPSSKELFHRFISNNIELHTFTFSSGLSALPFDLFSAFDKPLGALQKLYLHSSKAIKSQHLKHFPSIAHLTVSGCSGIGDDLPFQCMPRLQEMSFLGRGLSLSSVWKLFQHETIRKITLDVAGSAYESCICSERMPTTDTASAIQGQTACPDKEVIERFPFPAPLDNFRRHNILSSTIPSWVVAFFIASSPSSLESVSLHGAIVPTCCSIRSSLPPPSLMGGNQTFVSSNDRYPFTYRSMLRSSILGLPLLQSVLNILPRLPTKAFVEFWRNRDFPFMENTKPDAPCDARSVRGNDSSAAATLATLSFRTLRGLVAGTSATCPLSGTEGNDADRHQRLTKMEEAGAEEPSDLSDSESNGIEDGNERLDAGETQGIDPMSQGSRRRHRTQSVSGMSGRRAKVARTGPERSASKLMTGRDKKKGTCNGQDIAHSRQKRANSMFSSMRRGQPGSSYTFNPFATLSEATSSGSIESSPAPSAQEIADAKQAALVQLLAISSLDDSAPPPTFSHFGNVGTSRLSPQQTEWLHSVTRGRIVRLEL